MQRAKALKCLHIREIARRPVRSKMKQGGDGVNKLDFLLSDHASVFQTFYEAQSEDNLSFKEIYVFTCKYRHNAVK